jgi:acetylglutamate kinase
VHAHHAPDQAEAPGGQILNVNADVAARALARAIAPFKIVFLTETGGLLDADGQRLDAVNLAEDYERLLAEPWVHSGMRLKLQEIKQLLDELPPTSSVSITAPEHLARELFTHRGAGTLVRQGERIDRFEGETMARIDRERLRGLVEECFGRRLAGDYFEHKRFFRIYLADSYRATAILTREPVAGAAGQWQDPVPYLDKFAVTQEAQGIGIGGSIWARMRRDNPRLFWRARADNPVNPWYFEHADGSYREGRWTVFWYGLASFDEARACVAHALALPATLE